MSTDGDWIAPGGRIAGRDDTADLIEDCVAELARRRARYAGDDAAAIGLLASVTVAAAKALADRIRSAVTSGDLTWTDAGELLGISATEALLRYGPEGT